MFLFCLLALEFRRTLNPTFQSAENRIVDVIVIDVCDWCIVYWYIDIFHENKNTTKLKLFFVEFRESLQTGNIETTWTILSNFILKMKLIITNKSVNKLVTQDVDQFKLVRAW